MALPLDWNIPPAIRSRFGDRLGRQRAMEADGHLLIVLHKVPTGVDPARQPIAYWRDAQGQWSCSAGGDGLPKLVNHIAEYEKRVDQLEAEYDSANRADEWFAILQQVVRVHRATSNLLATIQSAREALPDDRDLITLRDRASDAERAIELLHHDVKNALDYAVARQAEEQSRLTYLLSRSGHRLTMLAAIFFPLTALGALFGMNIPSGLDRSHPAVFWTLVLLALTCGAAIFATMMADGRPRDGRRSQQRSAHHRTKLVRQPPGKNL